MVQAYLEMRDELCIRFVYQHRTPIENLHKTPIEDLRMQPLHSVPIPLSSRYEVLLTHFVRRTIEKNATLKYVKYKKRIPDKYIIHTSDIHIIHRMALWSYCGEVVGRGCDGEQLHRACDHAPLPTKALDSTD
jgi:hypothetical protein